MQLILVLALLLLGSGYSPKNPSKGGIAELFQPETMDLIRELSGGGEEIEQFVREVEQISEIVSVFAPLMQAGENSFEDSAFTASTGGRGEEKYSQHTAPDISYILKPVRNIADDGIYNALARAV